MCSDNYNFKTSLKFRIELKTHLSPTRGSNQLIWFLHVGSRVCASLCCLYYIAIFQYVSQNSTFKRQNKIGLLFSNVY